MTYGKEYKRILKRYLIIPNDLQRRAKCANSANGTKSEQKCTAWRALPPAALDGAQQVVMSQKS